MLASLRRHPISALFLALVIGFAIWGSILNYMETPEERAAARQQASENAARQELARRAKAAVDAEKREGCHSERLCRDYAQARQECAVAGSFDTCIRIKMGADASSIYDCTEDGKLRGSSPSWDECLLLSPLEALRGH